MNIPLLFFPPLNKAAQCCASAAAAAAEFACLRGAESESADTRGHRFTATRRRQNTDICHSWQRAALPAYSCLTVSQVSIEGAARPTGCATIPAAVAVNQPITNKCHLVFGAALAVLLLWGHRTVILQFPNCQDAAMASFVLYTIAARRCWIRCAAVGREKCSGGLFFFFFGAGGTFFFFVAPLSGFQRCLFQLAAPGANRRQRLLPEMLVHCGRCAVKRRGKKEERS